MLIRKLAIVVLVFGALGIAGAAFAQSIPDQPKSLGDRIDDFFSGLLGTKSAKKAKTKDAATPKADPDAAEKTTASQTQDTGDVPPANSSRAGTAPVGPGTAPHQFGRQVIAERLGP